MGRSGCGARGESEREMGRLYRGFGCMIEHWEFGLGMGITSDRSGLSSVSKA